MAYNRENYLLKVLEVQEIALHYNRRGLFYKEIFHLYINKQYHISKRTFHTYLGINARKQIKELRARKQENEQLKLF